MYNLRLATNSDYNFLFSLLTITLKQYYIETYGKWDDTVERKYFDESFQECKYQIISYDGKDIGCLAKENNPNEIFIHEIQILPKYQNKGIGSMIIGSIIEESERLTIPIKLEVLKSNKKARNFYHRMNFSKSGESESHITMIRNPKEAKEENMNLTLSNEIKEILSLSEINGGHYWSRNDGNIHAPYGFSTIDVLNTLGDIGLHASDSKIILNTIEFIFTYFDGKGCFKYSPKSSKLPCITALILTAFGRLGYNKDKRIEKCYQYLLESQQKDGGWRCATVKLGKSPGTDSSNPGTTLYVLDAFRFRTNSKDDTSQLDKGVLFLLKHWETRTPLGPCEFGIGSRFLSIEYPFLRYNLFYYVYVLSKYKIAHKDRRYKDALDTLIKRTKDYKIFPESPHKSWQKYSFAQKNIYSEMATKRFQEIIGE